MNDLIIDLFYKQNPRYSRNHYHVKITDEDQVCVYDSLYMGASLVVSVSVKELLWESLIDLTDRISYIERQMD